LICIVVVSDCVGAVVEEANEFCILFPDHRMVLGIANALNLCIGACTDGWPYSLRKHLTSHWIAGTIVNVLLLIFILYILIYFQELLIINLNFIL